MEKFIQEGALRLSLYEMRLFLWLFHLNNRARWAEWFDADNVSLAAGTRLDERNLIRAKNGLKAKGMIDFIPGRRGIPSKYKLISLTNYTGKIDRETNNCTGKNDSVIVSVTDSVTDSETMPQSRIDKGLEEPLRRKNKEIRQDIYSNDLFLKFYGAYPRKQGKRDAAKAFQKLNPDADLFQRMMQALETQKASADWRKEGGKFVPYPATWINGERWDDEIGGTAKQPTMTQEEMEALGERVEREQEERARLEAERWKQRGTN